MKVRLKAKIGPIHTVPGDTINLIYKEEGDYGAAGKVAVETTVLTAPIEKAATFDEAVIFEVDDGDFVGAVGGIGGAFLILKKVEAL